MFNSSKINYTDLIETKNYLFIYRSNPTHVVAVPKESNYKALSGTLGDIKNPGAIADISLQNYTSDFLKSPVQILARVDVQGDKSKFSMVPLQLGKIEVSCFPLTNLLSFFNGEEQKQMNFSIIGVNDQYAYIPTVKFTFNVFYIYNYSNSGSFFWFWIWLSFNIVLFIFIYRLIRLGLKRKEQSKGLMKINELMKGMAPIITSDVIQKTLMEDSKKRREKKNKTSGGSVKKKNNK